MDAKQSVSTMKSHNFGEIEKDWKTTGEILAYFEDQPSNNNCMKIPEPTIKNKLICGMIAGVVMLPIMLAIHSQQAGQQATEQRQAAQIKANRAAYQQEKRHIENMQHYHEVRAENAAREAQNQMEKFVRDHIND
jgi:hypothetical protein